MTSTVSPKTATEDTAPPPPAQPTWDPKNGEIVARSYLIEMDELANASQGDILGQDIRELELVRLVLEGKLRLLRESGDTTRIRKLVNSLAAPDANPDHSTKE